jgi:diaminohydroxyphosphoribosylaminopyrimidine deaminase/5-amino-6-(5-phosphoribosylamino)uracil reductase
MTTTVQDLEYMCQALELAARARGYTSPNPMVGAVLVKDGRVVGQGYHKQAGQPHAEVEALRVAGAEAKGATLYVNLEPCCHTGRTPPCTDALIQAGVKRVVAAMPDPNPKVAGQGIEILRAQGIEVEVGLCEKDALRLNEAFCTFHRFKRPFVVAKWAMTLDGRTSADNGSSQWISNEASREYVHRVRASLDAVGVGVGTVFFDDPELNVRLPGYEGPQPRRVIFDGSLRVPLAAKCLSAGGGQPLIVCSPDADETRLKRLRDAGYTVAVSPGRGRVVDLKETFEMLCEYNILSILVEGGRQLHTSLLSAGLADKVIVFVAPKIIGGRLNTSPVDALGIDSMTEALELRDVQVHAFGCDACIEGYINSSC